MDSNESQLNDEVAHALVAADALGKASKSTNPITDSITDALKDLEMDRYDEEDDGILMVTKMLSFHFPNFIFLPILFILINIPHWSF